MAPRAHMRDICKVGTPGAVTGPNPTPTYTYGSAIRCRYSRTRPSETVTGTQIALTDVEIRVPRSTTVTTACRIQLTKLDGTTLGTAQYYAIVGEPWQTLGEKVLTCRLLTGGSAK